jgi:hypothetical protein
MGRKKTIVDKAWCVGGKCRQDKRTVDLETGIQVSSEGVDFEEGESPPFGEPREYYSEEEEPQALPEGAHDDPLFPDEIDSAIHNYEKNPSPENFDDLDSAIEQWESDTRSALEVDNEPSPFAQTPTDVLDEESPPPPADLSEGVTPQASNTPATPKALDDKYTRPSDPDKPDDKHKLYPWTGKISKHWLAGLSNTIMKESVPKYNDAPCERVEKGQNNTFIILGRDRPMGFASGYGGRGHTQAGAIDIVVGLQGWGPQHKMLVEKNFGSMGNDKPGDAARIYISQKADIDQYFDICEGSIGNSEKLSAIGIKADSVRIMARRGIKIVTGQSPQQRTSKDGKIEGQFGIDLIAGNRDNVPAIPGKGNIRMIGGFKVSTDQPYLQPIPKGINLRDCLLATMDIVLKINTMMTDFLARQMIINSTIAKAPIIGAGGSGPVTSFSTSQPTVAGLNLKLFSNTWEGLLKQQKTITFMKANYLSPIGAVYINSRYNRTN